MPPGETQDVGSINCPKCSKRMAQVEEAGIRVDRCGACGGIWLDALEKDRLLAAKGAAARIDTAATPPGPRAAASGATMCPRDKSMLIRMVDHKKPHVHFESCKICGGVFLEAGELRDLAHPSLLDRLRSMLGR